MDVHVSTSLSLHSVIILLFYQFSKLEYSHLRLSQKNKAYTHRGKTIFIFSTSQFLSPKREQANISKQRNTTHHHNRYYQ